MRWLDGITDLSKSGTRLSEFTSLHFTVVRAGEGWGRTREGMEPGEISIGPGEGQDVCVCVRACVRVCVCVCVQVHTFSHECPHRANTFRLPCLPWRLLEGGEAMTNERRRSSGQCAAPPFQPHLWSIPGSRPPPRPPPEPPSSAGSL